MFKRTSVTHPLRIDVVQPPRSNGLIGMSFCPGKRQIGARTGDWDRDLALDLNALQTWGANIVVSLIEDHEFEELGVPTLAEEVRRKGMTWHHLPIKDMSPPDGRFQALWPQLGDELINALKNENRIFFHCKGGLGRTGTVVACLLIESGMAADDAINAVRIARRNTIETTTQERFVSNYKILHLQQVSNAHLDEETYTC